jgi:hypothetical protein
MDYYHYLGDRIMGITQKVSGMDNGHSWGPVIQHSWRLGIGTLGGRYASAHLKTSHPKLLGMDNGHIWRKVRFGTLRDQASALSEDINSAHSGTDIRHFWRPAI